MCKVICLRPNDWVYIPNRTTGNSYSLPLPEFLRLWFCLSRSDAGPPPRSIAVIWKS